MNPPDLSRTQAEAGAVPQSDENLDAQLAAYVATRLAWDAWVPKNAVQVRVEQGWVTLQGELPHERDRTAAMEDVSRLFGIKGVTDRTTLRPR